MNVKRGRDDTLFAIADGYVVYDYLSKGCKRVNVIQR
jgi:ribosomal protein L27